MELLVLLIALVLLGLLAVRFGYDSRDGFRTRPHGIGSSTMGWTDPAYDQELAREALSARQRCLVTRQAFAARLKKRMNSPRRRNPTSCR